VGKDQEQDQRQLERVLEMLEQKLVKPEELAEALTLCSMAELYFAASTPDFEVGPTTQRFV